MHRKVRKFCPNKKILSTFIRKDLNFSKRSSERIERNNVDYQKVINSHESYFNLKKKEKEENSFFNLFSIEQEK